VIFMDSFDQQRIRAIIEFGVPDQGIDAGTAWTTVALREHASQLRRIAVGPRSAPAHSPHARGSSQCSGKIAVARLTVAP